MSSRIGDEGATIETIDPTPVVPWDEEPLPRSLIAKSKEIAIEEHEEVLEGMRSGEVIGYSDGSLADGRAGSGAVIGVKGESGTNWYSVARILGNEQTVFTAELDGLRQLIDMLDTLLSTMTLRPPVIPVFIDNQAVVRVATSAQPGPGQEIRIAIRQAYRRFVEHHPTSEIDLHWIPGHYGVEGNELADEAATWASSEDPTKVEGKMGKIETAQDVKVSVTHKIE